MGYKNTKFNETEINQDVINRFWNKVDKNSDCWEWKGALLYGGYGQFWANSKQVLAHRFSWMLHFGEIPEGLCICHRCDNRKCVNPNHLFTGTYKDNLSDMVNKGRSSFGQRNGRSRLTEKEVLEIRQSNLSSIKLALKYSVGETTVQHIKHNRTWRHL